VEAGLKFSKEGMGRLCSRHCHCARREGNSSSILRHSWHRLSADRIGALNRVVTRS